MEALYGMLSQRLWLSRGAAGERRVLVNAADHPLREWDSRGQRHRHSYDELQRPTHLFVRTADGVESLAERVFYGEGADDAAARNLRQQVHVVFDSAGRRELVAADFRGLPLRISRGLAGAYRADPDWSALADAPDLAAADRLAAPLLGPDRFDATTEYDALSRPVVSALPDGSRREPRYNAAGLLEGIGVRLRGAAETTSFLTDLEYDAKGQRTAETYGNGVRCAYSYDPDTLRLAGMRAERAGEVLQDLSYAYDPVGNVVGVRDAAQQTRFFDNAVVGADLEYEHDAAYRLVLARGRERVAGQPGPRGDPPFPLPHPNDGTAVQRYVERYEHDLAGNLVRVEHRGGDGGWTRAYDYAADSDRLRGSSLPGDAPGTFSARYEHDAHGSVTAMPHLPALSWSHADRLREVDLGAGERAFYVYDAKGERVRKVIERNGARKEERVYCGEFETYRRFVADAVRFERETLHVGQGGHRVALVETETVVDGRREETPRSRRRFQTCDHLSSVSVETDEAGAVISYEQYLPFGAGAYRSARADLEASPKRYGYVGRELDVETGFGHHGARQYAPWLGRFVSFDPLETTGAGKSGDANGYAYAHNNPVVLSDPNGMISWGQAIGFGVAVAVGVAVTVFTGGIAGPIVAGVLGGMAAGFAGEVVEQLVDHGRVKDWKAVGISTAVGGLLGGLFAGAGAAIAKGLSSAAGRAVVAKAANHTIGQTVLKAAYAVSRSIVGRSARAAGKAIRSASTPVQEAGEATGRSMGGWFATNAARQQAAREGAEQAVAAASQPTGKGVRAAIVGEADGAPLNASTHSGQHRPNKQTVDGRRTIVTPEGEVPPPSTPPPPPLQAHEVAPANGGKPYLRDHDAEFKLFGHVINTTQPGASGNLYISAGQPMCPSCTANAWNFRVGRPNLNLSVGAPDVPTAGGAGALVPPLVQPGREGDPPPTVPVLQFNF
jgi:RHS repeat-associated protein